MIGPAEAAAAAGLGLHGAPTLIDPAFALFADAALGEPLLVRDVEKQPAYWVVPVVVGEKVVGSLRVSPAGQVEAIGAYCRDAASLPQCPETLTRISADEAERRAAARIDAGAGEVAGPAVYVHDGPPGKEAWLVEAVAPGRPARRIFVTEAGAYERPTG